LACLFLYDKIRVSLYVADPNYIDAALHPYSWYKRFVIDGARQHHLSREYVDTITVMPDTEDPDPTRDWRNRAIAC